MKTSKNSRLALSIAGALCSLPLFLTNAHAFGGPPGGPFSNGSYFPNDGTFSAVVRGTFSNNGTDYPLVGTIQFSTSTTSTSGSTGVSTFYFNGYSFSGNSQGAYDPSESSMTINFQSNSQGLGETTYSSTNATTSTETTFIFFDSRSLTGFANCQTSNSFPNQKFSGSGKAEFQQLIFTSNAPQIDYSDIDVSVTGVRLSNTATAFNTATLRPPSYLQYTATP